MKILGIVENMSGLVCPHCGKIIEVLKTKGGLLTAEKEELRLFGTYRFQNNRDDRGNYLK